MVLQMCCPISPKYLSLAVPLTNTSLSVGSHLVRGGSELATSLKSLLHTPAPDIVQGICGSLKKQVDYAVLKHHAMEKTSRAEAPPMHLTSAFKHI